MSVVAPQPDVVSFAVFEVDLKTGELRKHGLRLKLQDQPFKILAMLLEHPGELVTREQIKQKLWPEDTFVDFEHSVNTAIRRLREVLGDDADTPRFIETLPKRRYRFIGVVQPAEATADAKTEQPIKRLFSPAWIALAGFIVLGAVAAILVLHFWPGSPIDSVAVLPLVNGTKDSGLDYLADGISEEVINELTEINTLRVMSRNSAFTFRKQPINVGEAARAMGVRALVVGALRRSGDRLEVSVELIDAYGDRHLIGRHYSLDPLQVAAVQLRIAEDVARGLRQPLTADMRQRMARTEFPKAAAYDAYLHGRYLVQVRANPNFQTALRYFHAATDADPNFALGYAGMAEAYGALAAYGGMEPAEGFRLKEAAQNRALELDPNLAYAIVSKAYSLEMYHHDLAGAEREMRRAVELNWPEARHHHARILEDAGRLDEALAESRRSEELDPLWSVNSGTTDFILYKARRFDESLEHCRRTQRCGHYWLGLMHAAAGRKAEAVTELKQVKTTVPRALCLAALAWATIGEEARARAVLADTLREQKQQGNSTLNWCSPYEVASVHAELGDRAESLRWLAAADAQLDSRLFFVLSDAAWDRYRSDPEFVALLKRIQTPR